MEIADDFDAIQNAAMIFFKHKCGHGDFFAAYHDWNKFPCNCTGQIVVCPYHTYIKERRRELEAQLCDHCRGEEHG